jgi:hypothetical protein
MDALSAFGFCAGGLAGAGPGVVAASGFVGSAAKIDSFIIEACLSMYLKEF